MKISDTESPESSMEISGVQANDGSSKVIAMLNNTIRKA